MIDLFPITKRLTVLQQQTKSVQKARHSNGAASSTQLESIKHMLWHGNVEEARERVTSLPMDLDLIRDLSISAEKLTAGVAEFETEIRNNQESIPNRGERYRQSEPNSTAFVESTITLIVSRRFVKRQQMHWTESGSA